MGAYVEAVFGVNYRFTKFDFYQREKNDDRISKLSICFGKNCENSESFVIKNTAGVQSFSLKTPTEEKIVRF